MIPLNKMFPYRDLIGKRIINVETLEEKEWSGFRLYFEDGSDIGFGSINGVTGFCGVDFDAEAEYGKQRMESNFSKLKENFKKGV